MQKGKTLLNNDFFVLPNNIRLRKGFRFMAELGDKTLVCKGCGNEFIFTVSEQEFYKKKGFENEPTRCPECRSQRKKVAISDGGEEKKREFTMVVCSMCGKQTQVPFKPFEGKPVYCRDCYKTRK